jgi:hypothetical protein
MQDGAYVRARKKAARDKYAKSEKGRAYYAARIASGKNAEAKRKYNLTAKAKSAWTRYNKSSKGFASRGIPDPTRSMPARCECCNGPPNAVGVLCIDHDHVTGTFRGWLCSKCNMGIGLLGDDREGLSLAQAYLALNG